MGVDHTAFACYGVKVVTDLGADELGKMLPRNMKVIEWGSRSYGGGGGFIVAVTRTHVECDFDDGVEARPMPHHALGDDGDLRAVVRSLPGVEIDGVPSWFVGGLTW